MGHVTVSNLAPLVVEYVNRLLLLLSEVRVVFVCIEISHIEDLACAFYVSLQWRDEEVGVVVGGREVVGERGAVDELEGGDGREDSG